MPHSPTPFRCDVESLDGTVTLRPFGELDMRTAPALEAQLNAARTAKTLIVDLRGLEFMDSTGLTLLTRWSLHAERNGLNLALVPGSERIQALFELTRLAPHFRFIDG